MRVILVGNAARRVATCVSHSFDENVVTLLRPESSINQTSW